MFNLSQKVTRVVSETKNLFIHNKWNKHNNTQFPMKRKMYNIYKYKKKLLVGTKLLIT